LAKLARLTEQADDEKANVFRNDIMSAFPLEVIVRIMEYGLSFDPLFVLRQSWVSRRWRNVLNHSCPELWRSWTIDHAELKGKHWESRRLAWKERSGSNISAVTLRGFTKEAVYKVGPTLRQGLRATKKLDIEVRNPAVLSELNFYGMNDAAIEELRISGGRLSRSTGRYEGRPDQNVTYGLPVKLEIVRAIELNGVSFHTYP
jgi:hypothetical protein